MVLAGLFASIRKKTEGGDEGGGLDLQVLGLEDVTSNRIVKRGFDMFAEAISVQKRVADAVETIASATAKAEEERRTQEIVDRRVDEELARREAVTPPGRRPHTPRGAS